MSREAQLAGVTAYVLKLSSYYAHLGVGVYTPKGYSQFDKVTVSVEQPFEVAKNGLLSHSCSILRVSFFANNQLQRYVDFAVAVAGFSGKPVVKEVPPPERL